MSKNPKFTIKNTQIAGAIDLQGLKAKLAKKLPHDEAGVESPAAKESVGEKKKKKVVAAKDESASIVVKKTTTKKDSIKKETVRKSAPKADEDEVVSVRKHEEPPVVPQEPAPAAVLPVEPAAKKEEPFVVPQRFIDMQAERQKKQAASASSHRGSVPRESKHEVSSAPARTFHDKPFHRPAQDRALTNDASHARLSDRPYQPRPFHDRTAQPRPLQEKPSYDRPNYERPRQERPHDRYNQDRSGQPRSYQDRPYRPSPSGDRQPGGYSARRQDDGRPYTPRSSEGRPFTPRAPGSGPYSSSGPRPYPPRTSAPRGPAGSGPARPPVNPMAVRGVKDGPVREGFGEKSNRFDQRKGTEIVFKQGKKGKDTKRDEKDNYDSRVRHGLVSSDDSEMWRKKRHVKQSYAEQHEVQRPTKVKVRLPITLKDLAAEMKLKASELISKLFLQGTIVTLNQMLDDETTVQLLGHEFGCEIVIDTVEQERIRITDKTAREEIAQEDESTLVYRPPVVAFMGHVDHGKTSLIDAIRKSNRASKEVGAITQHIGAFQCTTSHGPITILDTPGHEAFTLMRERGAEITDIVVLVIAGDEGVQEQTIEALNQARKTTATIVVAITKCDKPHFNADNVMRQITEHNLLPEAWGGQTVTMNCSAVSGEGVNELLEMLALQAEILELKANPHKRARGVVIESEVIQGLGDCATVLVQNGTLRTGDALVFATSWAKIKSMRDENGRIVTEAMPSSCVLINGMSSLPEAGDEFIVVKSEKEAREIAETRQEGKRQSLFMTKRRLSVEHMMQSQVGAKKILNLIIRADVQGSLEALRKALEKIKSEKVGIEFISQGVGQISESDIQLAMASKSVILGFHTALESHAEPIAKQSKVDVRLHDIIYHAVDDITLLMKGLLDKVAREEERGKAVVKACFKSSQLGLIAGCQVSEGVITRSCQIRVRRGADVVWKGGISSLKRVKEDVKEVQKGVECGILLQGYTDVQVDDVFEAYEVIYLEQEL